MQYAILSDIHSNIEALEAVVAELRNREISKVLCLGDTVGYGANPNECCNLVREISECAILGNHDAGSIGLTNLSHFHSLAKEVCVWTSKTLTTENISWLKSLPFQTNYENSLLSHSAPSKPERWHYVSSMNDAINEFPICGHICFVGHTHVPVTFVKIDSKYKIITNPKFSINPDYNYIINPGSVGQPRDRNSNSSFAIYDSEIGEIETIRISYDIDAAQKKIINAGLPKSLAERLSSGT
ncbi:MAG: metallophosphoesterase family protein [bacterium]|nr:metallophosphoesterase family protein [bacterium]